MRHGFAAGVLAIGLAMAAPSWADQPVSAWTTVAPQVDAGAPPLVQQGQIAFQARCHLCHGGTAKDAAPGFGARMAGTEALAAKYKGSKPALLEERTDLTEEVVRYYVRNGSGIMPFFRKTELSDQDLMALAAYLTRKNH